MRLLFAASLLISLLVPANSQTLTMGGYLHPRNADEKALFSMYVAGLRDGFMFYKAWEHAVNPTAEELYCPPKDIALVTPQAEEIIRRWAEQHKDSIKDDSSVGLTLLLGLIRNFPCPK
jgi:hypothetical protein